MRVVIDGRRLQDRPLTGAGRWLANLLPFLAAEVDVMVLTDARRPPAPTALPQTALRPAPRLPEVVWLQWHAARWLRSEEGLFHGAFEAVPFACRQPTVVTLFDLAFEHHPEDFSEAKRRLFCLQARWAAHHARTVITISEDVRRSIVDTYHVDPSRVVVAPPSVDPIFSTAAATTAVIREPYVVAVGGARRRGLEVAVAAWQELRAAGHDIDLVVVGRDDPGSAPGLVHLGRVDDQAWAGVLAGARALCYPTRYEGYGMPALEAAACGVPVVCGRVGPLPEVLGEAAEWCDPTDHHSVGAALARVIDDPARHDQLRTAGLARVAAAPTWESSARVVLDAYRHAGVD